ncbi:MAG: hypothetical protein AAFY88_06650, partial [Acidobacteriota bacterium]
MSPRPTSMATALAVALALGVLGPRDALADEEPPPQVGVWRATVDGLPLIEAVIPDVPLAAAAWPGGGMAVLSRPAVDPNDDDAPDPDELPRLLYRVRGDAADVEPVLRDLPADLDAIHRDGSTLWLGGDGALYRLGDGGLELVAGSPDDGDSGDDLSSVPSVDLPALVRGNLLADGGLWAPDVGRLVQLDADGSAVGEQKLPVSADRSRRRLTLRSPPVTRLDDGTLIAGPRAFSKTRIQHLILGDGEPVEAWSRLPRPEDIERHWYDRLNGEPVFIAATTQADRLGIFEKLELRLFRLKADRTRAGRSPVIAVPSETVRWYQFEPRLLDWNDDG